MAIFDMKDYSPAARRYWFAVVALGYAALAYAVHQVSEFDWPILLQVLGGAAVAAVVALFPVRIPGTKTSIAGGEIFIVLIMLLYGVPAGMLAASIEGLVASWRTSKRWTSRFGTPAMAALAMLFAGTLLETARAYMPANGWGRAAMVTSLLVFGVVYFAANTLLTSTLIALKNRAPVSPLKWWRSMGWISMAYMTSGSIAGLLFISFERFGVPVLLVGVPLITMFLSSLHSYFQRKEADEQHMQQLKASESRFHSAFTHAAIGMALVSTEGRFLQANKSYCDMLGRPAGELLASTLDETVHDEDVGSIKELVDKLLAGEIQSIATEVRGNHSDGTSVWMALNVSLARDWQFRTHNLIIQAQDISARRRAEAELYHTAYHDSLTQLSNRTHFNEQLNRAIARAQRHAEQRFAVMYLDFDRFKMVNDSLGHRAGDELLVHLARRLQSILRPMDVIARLGGDEFAILLENVQHERDAVQFTERIQKELNRPFQLGEMEVTISASIGITFSTNGYQTAEQIIRDADIAMYKAKSKGKAQYALFDASLHQHVAAQLKLESELRRALSQGQIYLQYQPIYMLRDQRLIGFEALVRWRHPERGLLDPGEFIPTAEETGLIVPLGNWILMQACQQMRLWCHAYDNPGLRMSVNVSSMQLNQPDFVARVRDALVQAQLSPSQLTLEVTESVLMNNIQSVIPILEELRRMGVMLSIDDFGTGYSSLNYLATLPIDALKVDRSFVERMTRDGQGNEIVKAIFRLGQALSKQVYAEGIETGTQLLLLQELGCEYGQGYLLSRPLDPEHAAGFVAARAKPAMGAAAVVLH
ncbi:MAG TPA: EAL domain-containing protein [Usitatibacter sp.]|nr:EAL domain-containing protein [Usitatibacter sp.]